MLDRCIRSARCRRLIQKHPQVAGDSTGLETGHTSFYFRSRRGLKHFYVPKWPKLTICADIHSHLVVAATVSVGPTRDTIEAPEVLRAAHRRVKFRRVLWDGGCDSEAFHELVRDELHAHSLVPIKSGQPTRKWPKTKYRRQMKKRFFKRLYGQRWQVESVFSRHKRKQTSELRSKTWHAQQAEVYLRVLVHNLAFLGRLFSRFSTEQII